MKDYIDRLKELREDRDIKQKEIATLLGINQNTYSQYETKKRKMPIEEFRKLCIFYRVSADELLGLTNIPT